MEQIIYDNRWRTDECTDKEYAGSQREYDSDLLPDRNFIHSFGISGCIGKTEQILDHKFSDPHLSAHFPWNPPDASVDIFYVWSILHI